MSNKRRRSKKKEPLVYVKTRRVDFKLPVLMEDKTTIDHVILKHPKVKSFKHLEDFYRPDGDDVYDLTCNAAGVSFGLIDKLDGADYNSLSTGILQFMGTPPKDEVGLAPYIMVKLEGGLKVEEENKTQIRLNRFSVANYRTIKSEEMESTREMINLISLSSGIHKKYIAEMELYDFFRCMYVAQSFLGHGD